MAYAAYDLDNLRARLTARTDGVPFWDMDEATAAINEALCTWNMLTGRWVRRVIMETTPGEHDYALPATLSYRTRVLYNNLPMSPASREDFNNGRPRWYRETTASGGSVPTTPTLWAPVSLQLIWIWPADAAGHHSLTIDGISATPVLVAGSDFVDLGEDDLSILLGFALHVLTFKKGSIWFTATRPYFLAFLRAAGAENQMITTSQMYRRYLGLDKRDLKPLRSGAIQSPSVALAEQMGGG